MNWRLVETERGLFVAHAKVKGWAFKVGPQIRRAAIRIRHPRVRSEIVAVLDMITNTHRPTYIAPADRPRALVEILNGCGA